MTRKHPLLLVVPTMLLILIAFECMAQTDPGQFRYSTAKTVGFFATFVKTPFALMVAVVSFLGAIAAGFFEFWGWLFTGFDYKFPVTGEIWDIGWRGVVKQWWWAQGVTWHLILSLFIWLGILGKSSR